MHSKSMDMDCEYKFKSLISYAISRKSNNIGRSTMMMLMIIAIALIALPFLLLLLILFLPWEIGIYLSPLASLLLIVAVLYLLFLIGYAVLRIAFKK